MMKLGTMARMRHYDEYIINRIPEKATPEQERKWKEHRQETLRRKKEYTMHNHRIIDGVSKSEMDELRRMMPSFKTDFRDEDDEE